MSLPIQMLENYHPVTSKIAELLETNNMWFETFEHEPVRTSEEASKVRDGYTIDQGAKALIIRVKISSANKKFVMLVLPGVSRFDVNRVKQLFEAKDIRFATEQEVDDLTIGVKPGGVPPFGNLFDIEVIVDPQLFENEKIVFNAGDKSFSVGMYSKDYLQLVDPQVVSILS